tara:strand:+ start:5107 stop:6357 length:1251 start_codon:yes stop_codon:yes gene_type:complete
MGADKVLVEGAYAAAGGGIDRSEGFSALSAAGKRVGEELSKDIEKKSKEFKDYMDWELNKNPGLNPEERKQLAEELQKKRMQYITGDGEQRSMMMSDLANDKHQYGKLDALKKDIAAKSNSTMDGFADNTEWMASEQGQSVYQAMQGAPIKNEDGQYGYMIKDNEGGQSFQTIDQIHQLVREQSFDRESNELLHGYTISEMEKSSKLLHGNNPEFGYDQAYMKIGAQVNKGNIRSLVHDEHIPGRSFYDDLQIMLQNNTYDSLGITAVEDPTPGDGPDGGDNISPDDAKQIADSLLQNKNMTKQYLTTYFTNYVEQNWGAAAKNRKDYTLTEEQKQKELEDQISKDDSSETSVEQEGKRSDFEQAFASHRAKMIQEHGMDYSKWTNFEFNGEQYHPFTKDDEKSGAQDQRVNTDYA